MGLTVEFGVAKINKYASRESGDTVEIVERPGGGLTAVLIDGQGSGNGAKALSTMLAAKVVGLIKDGVRDGAVARAAHDMLHISRGGKVSAALELLSVDLEHDCVLLTRNSNSAAVIVDGAGPETVWPGEGPIGTGTLVKPEVRKLRLEAGLFVWIVSDGVCQAGRRHGDAEFPLERSCAALSGPDMAAAERANALLARAIAADRGHPADDMSVVLLAVAPSAEPQAPRRMQVTLPIP